MSRTNRSTLTHNRENDNRTANDALLARWKSMPIGAFDDPQSAPLFGTFRGGMLMCPSSCGIWSDERPYSYSPSGRRARKMQRRNVKRSERQKVKAAIEKGDW